MKLTPYEVKISGNLTIQELKTLIQNVREFEIIDPERHIDILMEKNSTTIKMNKSLSVEELRKFVQCIRDIEQNDPKRHIGVFVYSPDKTISEMQEVLCSITPKMDIQIITKDD